jgi:hypothetical protein
MTTSSATKDNPKGNKRVNKHTTSVSSSLKSIMKYGGSTAGQKDSVRKKNLGGKTVVTDGRSKRKSNDIDDDTTIVKDLEMAEAKQNTTDNVEEKDGHKQTKDNVDGSEDTEMMESEGKENTDNDGSKWDRPKEDTDNNLSTGENVTKWEKEIERLEKVAAWAATEKYKTHIEHKLHEAQRMLKEVLLRLTIAQEDPPAGVQKKTISGRYIDMNKDMNKVIDLTKEVDLEDKCNKGTNIVAGMESLNETNSKTVFDSRRGMDTFKWGDESDDDTVVFQNQSPTTKERDWQTIQSKKQIKKTSIDLLLHHF